MRKFRDRQKLFFAPHPSGRQPALPPCLESKKAGEAGLLY
jgi:hypothetical protein